MSASDSTSGAGKQTDTAYVPFGNGFQSGPFAPDRDIQSSASPDAEDDGKDRVFVSRVGIASFALSAVSIVLAAFCVIMLVVFPKALDDANQPDRSENSKTDALLVDLNDQASALNMPGCVRTSDVTKSKINNLPSSINSGGFYALWDCDVLSMEGDGKTHLLVTMREMYPVPGRVWVNWYNWTKWTGWKAYSPS